MFDLFKGSPELNSQESAFINLYPDHPTLKYARQNYVNRRFGKKLFSIYENYTIVGLTLSKNRTKVIRIFFNKHNRPEGDRVVESVKYPPEQFAKFLGDT
jgi:hypothetical protein